MRQSLAKFSRNFVVQKLTLINFGDILKRFFIKLGRETTLQAEIVGHSVWMEYKRYSETVFDRKLAILTTLTTKFWNFENFEDF